MRKPKNLLLIIVIVLFTAIFGWNVFKNHMMKKYFAHFTPPAVTVSTTIAKQQNWQPYLSSVGTLIAKQGVDISAETAGVVEAVTFESGTEVQKGQPLIKIKDSVDQADLSNGQAQLKLAKLNYQRTKELFSKSAVSHSQLDEAEAKFKEAQAVVAKVQALIDQKNITAPFDGKIGIRRVSIGEYVSPGKLLATLQALDPMQIEFTLPEQALKDIKVGQELLLHVDTYSDKTFHGEISAINAKVNPQSHNILIQANLPNPNQQLYPGMFAKVKVLLPEQLHVVTVPETAISYSLYGDSIFVVKQDGKDKNGKAKLKVKRQYVKVSMRRNNEVAISEGIQADDQIVDAGQLKLQNGDLVTINNKVKLNVASKAVAYQSEKTKVRQKPKTVTHQTENQNLKQETKELANQSEKTKLKKDLKEQANRSDDDTNS